MTPEEYQQYVAYAQSQPVDERGYSTSIPKYSPDALETVGGLAAVAPWMKGTSLAGQALMGAQTMMPQDASAAGSASSLVSLLHGLGKTETAQALAKFVPQDLTGLFGMGGGHELAKDMTAAEYKSWLGQQMAAKEARQALVERAAFRPGTRIPDNSTQMDMFMKEGGPLSTMGTLLRGR